MYNFWPVTVTCLQVIENNHQLDIIIYLDLNEFAEKPKDLFTLKHLNTELILFRDFRFTRESGSKGHLESCEFDSMWKNYGRSVATKYLD